MYLVISLSHLNSSRFPSVLCFSYLSKARLLAWIAFSQLGLHHGPRLFLVMVDVPPIVDSVALVLTSVKFSTTMLLSSVRGTCMNVTT